MHIVRFSAVLEDVHTGVLASDHFHGYRKSITRLRTRAYIVQGRVFGDDDHVSGGTESTDAALRSPVADEHRTMVAELEITALSGTLSNPDRRSGTKMATCRRVPAGAGGPLGQWPAGRASLPAFAAILALAASAGYFSPQKPTAKDTVVLADFENKTGDPIFDQTP